MSDNETTLRAFMERVWNQGDAGAVDDFLAPSYTIHSDPGDPWDGRTLDREGFKQRLVASRSSFPDLRFEIEEAVADGNRVVIAWTMFGTQTGAMGPIPPTGRPIAVKGMTVYGFEAGRIAGHRQVVDRLAVLQQLGLAGAPPARSE